MKQLKRREVISQEKPFSGKSHLLGRSHFQKLSFPSLVKTLKKIRSCAPVVPCPFYFTSGYYPISKLEMIKFPNWKWSNFYHIHNMEITKFPIQGNFHISMAGYFQHGNYPISKMCMWKLSHFHGPLSPTWKYENFQCLEIFTFPWLPSPPAPPPGDRLV